VNAVHPLEPAPLPPDEEAMTAAALSALGTELTLVGDHVAEVQRQLEAARTSIINRLDVMEADQKNDRDKLTDFIIESRRAQRETTETLRLQNALLERLLNKP
jgi:hypothetical protein